MTDDDASQEQLRTSNRDASHSRRMARLEFFRAAAETEPDLISELKERCLPNFQAVNSNWHKQQWRRLERLEQDANHSPDRLLAKPPHTDPQDVLRLCSELRAWRARARGPNGGNLLPFSGWIMDLALFTLWDLQHYPDQPLGYSWEKIPSMWEPERRPAKFVFTLESPDEEFWADSFDERWEQLGIENPYEAENSIYIEDYLRGKEPIPRAFRDWDPDTGESRSDARERILKGFRERLSTHLAAREREYKAAGLKRFQGKRRGSRDYVWFYQAAVWKREIDEFEPRTELNDESVRVQLRATADLLGVDPAQTLW